MPPASFAEAYAGVLALWPVSPTSQDMDGTRASHDVIYAQAARVAEEILGFLEGPEPLAQ